MKISILNGNPNPQNEGFDNYIQNIEISLRHEGCEANSILLRSYNIDDCIGCYSCWLKTPGICCLNDDMSMILREYLSSDIVVLASPIVMLYVSSLLKSVQDRMLPLMHPFLRLDGDRMAHLRRYEHYPKTVLLLDGDMKSSKYVRLVYNHLPKKPSGIFHTSQDIGGFIHEIVNL